MRWSLALLALPLLLSACIGGGSPPTHFFNLSPVPPSGGRTASLKGPPLQIRDIQLPPAVDRQEMVLNGPGTQVKVLGEDRWAAPLTGLVRNALTTDLRQRLGDSAVLSPGAPSPSSGGLQVLILSAQQFSADANGEVTLDTDWSVGRGNPPKVAISKHATIHVNAGSAQPQAVAEGMSRALGELADQIAAALQGVRVWAMRQSEGSTANARADAHEARGWSVAIRSPRQHTMATAKQRRRQE